MPEAKRVFVSYVQENLSDIERLCADLKSHGIEVWRDRENLGPGQRWRDAIRAAIRGGAFFLACFSRESVAKQSTYMNEELILAVEELRLMPRDRVWFLPVLLSEYRVPSHPIGPGETLQDLHHVDLYNDWDRGIAKLVDLIRGAQIQSGGASRSSVGLTRADRERFVQFLGHVEALHKQALQAAHATNRDAVASAHAMLEALDRKDRIEEILLWMEITHPGIHAIGKRISRAASRLSAAVGSGDTELIDMALDEYEPAHADLVDAVKQTSNR